ncbi:MAG: hypothetical protein M3Q65_19505 [Chloroflexota bacterium]|nr:hypothetical protein [Chloroflexota bacterium]
MPSRDGALHSDLRGDDPEAAISAIQTACRDQRADVLPDLIALLASEHVGNFVEECLPSFGENIAKPLKNLLHDPATPTLARQRAAGILALFGEQEAVPVLLKAIESPDVNQAYFDRLIKLAPERLADTLATVLEENADHVLTTTDLQQARYFAKLILTLGDVGAQRRLSGILERLLHGARDWRVQGAAAEALAVR